MIVWNIFVTLSRSLFLVQVLLMYLCQTVSSLPASDIWFGPTLIHTSCICPLWYWRLCMLMIHNHSFRHTQNVSLQVALSTLSVIVFRSLSQKHTHTHKHTKALIKSIASSWLVHRKSHEFTHSSVFHCAHTHTLLSHTPLTHWVKFLSHTDTCSVSMCCWWNMCQSICLSFCVQAKSLKPGSNT